MKRRIHNTSNVATQAVANENKVDTEARTGTNRLIDNRLKSSSFDVIQNSVNEKVQQSQIIQRDRKSKGQKKHGVRRPSQRNLKRMDEQSPKIDVDEGTGVLSLTLYDGYRSKMRSFHFSLARHWFPWLKSSPNDKNSVMHHDLSDSAIEADGRSIGLHIIAGIWGKTSVEPSSLKHTVDSGRKYQIDIVGSSEELNHFFVINGPSVENIDADQYDFYRNLSKYGWDDNTNEGAVKAAYAKLEGSLSHDKIEQVSGINIADVTDLNIADVNGFVASVRAYIERDDTPGHIAYSLLSPATWNDAPGGQEIFNRPYIEVSKAYDKALDADLIKAVSGGIILG